MAFLEGDPQGDQTTQWLGGLVAPLPFAIYGLMCIINRAGALPIGRRMRDHIQLEGIDATILGVACLSFGALLFFYYYCGLSENTKLKDNYEYGKLASLLVLIPSSCWMVWCILRGFMELY